MGFDRMLKDRILKIVANSCRLKRVKTYIWDILVNSVLASYFVPLFMRRLILNFCGAKCFGTIHAHCYIASNKLNLANGCYINRGCIIDNENALVSIGEYCSIGFGVMLLTTNHDISNPVKRGGAVKAKPIKIENGVWIGAGAKIMPGVCIQEGAVIAAGSIVTKNVPANNLYAGVPARKIRDCEDK